MIYEYIIYVLLKHWKKILWGNRHVLAPELGRLICTKITAHCLLQRTINSSWYVLTLDECNRRCPNSGGKKRAPARRRRRAARAAAQTPAPAHAQSAPSSRRCAHTWTSAAASPATLPVHCLTHTGVLEGVRLLSGLVFLTSRFYTARLQLDIYMPLSITVLFSRYLFLVAHWMSI